MALHRPITTIELLQIQKMFCAEHGYKDLIRDFKKDFGVDLPKAKAKEFMKNRKWYDVLLWLTGEEIEPPDADTLIPSYEMKKYVLLDEMLKYYKEDEIERNADLDIFEKGDYFINETVKFFNFPLYGEIITYKFKEPTLKCFLLDQGQRPGGAKTGKVVKIEDVPISDKLPPFLLRIIRKINSSVIRTEKELKDYINDPTLSLILQHVRSDEECKGKTNIVDSELFKKYSFKIKE